jgi:hypothetical protein
MARMRAAKARKRLERAQDEPERAEWRGMLEHTWTFHNRKTGVMHTMDLYRGKRRDQYDATIDGKPWKVAICATEIARYIRLKLKPHISE